MFEVTQGFIMDKFIVDLTNHTYTCYFWNLIKILCKHVIAAINYMHPFYKREAYQSYYRSQISPINGQHL